MWILQILCVKMMITTETEVHFMKLCAFADEAAESLCGQISSMQKNGISLLEIRHVDGINVSEFSESRAREIRKTLDAEGISVWSIGSPIGKYPISADFAPQMEAFRRTLMLADILGAKNIRLFSFFTENAEKTEDMKKEVLFRLSEFCRETPRSITLCHENEKEIFGDDIASCTALHTALPNLRAVFDPANFVQCGEDTEKAFSALQPYIKYMHIKDARADGTNVLAGDGEGKLPLLLRKYADMGGEVLTLEPHLKKFIGLDKLENGNNVKMQGAYKTGAEAFDAAAERLNQLISDTEKGV
jgi:sugar phosphate isomerase/epimerase